MKCPDCEKLEQKELNYELAKKLVKLHKANVIFFKDKHGFFRAELQTEFEQESGTIIEVLQHKRYPSRKI